MSFGKATMATKSPKARASRGLVLSAGGARGAYQIGCWKAFIEKGIAFSAVAGSSIGALNGALICQGDWEAAQRLWLELTRLSTVTLDVDKVGKLLAGIAGDIGLLILPVPNVGWVRAIKYATSVVKFASRYGSLGALRRNGLFNMTEIQPVLKRHIDMDRVRKQPISLFVTACGEPLATKPLGPAHWFKIQSQTEQEAWDVIAASMSVPFVFSPVRVGGEYYSDGGMGLWLPVAPLYRSGVRTMIVISTKADLAWKPQDYPRANIVLVKPQKALGRFPVATFRFTESAIRRWMDEGYEDALRVLDRHRTALGV